jgi:Methyltransferase small domain
MIRRLAFRLRTRALRVLGATTIGKKVRQMTERVDFHDHAVQDWYNVLYRSVNEPIIDGVEMPRFPHGSIQRGYVGQADAEAMGVACNFHSYVTKWAEALGHPLQKTSSVLDFGCGWGRVQRVFWHEVDAANLHGVDVDFSAVSISRSLGACSMSSMRCRCSRTCR